MTVVLNEHVLVPKLHRVKVGYVSDQVTVRMLFGQTVADWQAKTDALGHAFGAIGVRITALKPGWVAIEVHHTDTLAAPIPLPAHRRAGHIDLEALPVGVTEMGDPWRVRLLGRHLLVAGATGAGKG
ncbi:MAG: hypothetical protein ACRDPR_00695, partial [Nocardioidaceae bacterium]